MRGLIVILILCVFIQPAYAVLKKCVDDRGKFHYYDNMLPSECKGKATVEMNKQGVIINRVEASMPQSTEENKSEQYIKVQRHAHEENQNTVLLNIYTSAEEIDLALERNLHPVELAIIGIEKRLEIAKTRLDKLQKQADEAERSDSANFASIRKDIVFARREVKNLRKELLDTQVRMERIKAKFTADKQRFLVLVEKKNE